MTREEFIKELEERGYSYEIEGIKPNRLLNKMVADGLLDRR